MSEGKQNLQQQIQEQTVQTARGFYADSLKQLKGQLQGDRAQLEDLAKQLLEGDAQAQIKESANSYSRIEESLDRAAHDLGFEDEVNETAQQAQEAGRQVNQQARDEAGQDTAGGAVDQTIGVVGQTAGQVVESAQEAAGQALDQIVDQIGQVTENLPGGQLLSRSTNEAGQIVQRAVDESGGIIEITLNEACNIVDENLVGSLTDLPAEEEYRNEEGQTIRIVKDESGTLIELQLGDDGSILNIQISPTT